MAFAVCCAVYSKSADKLISEWKITQLGHQSATFRDFFNGPVASFIGSNNQLQLQAAYVGTNKVEQNPVFPLEMRMYDAMTAFGRYVKFIVEWRNTPGDSYSIV